MSIEMRKMKSPMSFRGKPRSLRMRLLLWYGTLLAVALGLFAVLILVLTMNAIEQNVDSDVMAEARVASLNVRPELSAQPPYWPPILSLDAIDTYRDPGVVIEILDAQDKIRYRSGSDISTTIPISTNAFKTTLNGQTTWYTANVSGERVRVEVLPIHASTEETIANTSGKTYNGSNTNISPTRNEPIVGVLLVAKSLDDVDDTFSMLRTLLLLSGLTILVGVLLGGWIIASRVLHPLAEIVETARTIATATTRGSRFTMPSQRVRRPRGNDEMVQVVDTFNEMLDSLERLTQTQRRFVADASHELRVPLTTIQGNHRFLQLYQAEITSEERQSVLTEVNEETVRLSRLVQDLLLLARADASETTLAVPEQMESLSKGSTHQSPLELDRVVLELVRKLRRRLSVEGSMLKLEIGHIEPVRVRGDEENVRRVTLILLDNAIKYTPTSYDEGTVARVTISLKQMDRMAVLCVRDSGIGIDPADLPHIFERFYRANRARPRQGTGLGLSIAQTLVEQLGGCITAESIPGQGSTFKVLLPLLHK
jgi:two-component system OmpR family sensor kinase